MPSLLATVGLNTSPFKTGLLQAQADAQHAGKQIKEAFGEAIGDKLGQLGSVAFLEESVRRTVEYAEKVDILSDRLGLSTEEVQKWDYALKLSGSSMESAASFFEKLNTARQKIKDGGKDAEKLAAAFEKLKVSSEGLTDFSKVRSGDIGLQIGKTIEEGDIQELIGSLRLIGGRGAGEMAAAFKSGLLEKMEAAPIISDEVIAQLREGADAGKTIWAQFIAGIAPGIAFIGRALKEAWEEANGAMRRMVGFAQGFLGGFADQLGRLSKGDIVGFSKHIADPISGGLQGQKELFEEYQNQVIQRDKIEKESREKRKAIGMIGEGEDSEGGAVTKKKTKQHEDLLKLKQEAFRLAEANALKELSAAQKVEEIQRRINRLKNDMLTSPLMENPIEAAKAEVEMTKLKGELSDAEKKKTDEEKRDLNKTTSDFDRAGSRVSDRVRAGGLMGASLDPMLTVAQKSEGHLKAILAGIDAMKKNASRTVH